MRALPLLLALSGVEGLLVGCASEIRVSSEPSDARLIVTREILAEVREDVDPKLPAGACYYGLRTPATFKIESGWRLYVAKAGYATAVREVDGSTADYHFKLEKKP